MPDKDCRDCAYCGMDMDDFYCGHPKTFEVSCVGINLNRMRAPNGKYPERGELFDKQPDPVWGLCGNEARLFEPRKA